ncbi:MAG: hypothetical protein ACLFVJ_18745 [Persicimonas sp.]
MINRYLPSLAQFTLRHSTAAVALLGLLLMLSSVSCRGDRAATQRSAPSGSASISSADNPDKTDEKADQADKFYHSPFVVALSGGEFDTVTFKDVGLPRDGDGPDEMLLEVISESFAQQIVARSEFDYDASVSYDADVLEPANHLHCEIDHLYVDVWRGSSPERWGYSLWSGCSERQNFAWREIPAPADDSDLADWVEPLTESITDTLAEASERGCFQKSC